MVTCSLIADMEFLYFGKTGVFNQHVVSNAGTIRGDECVVSKRMYYSH